MHVAVLSKQAAKGDHPLLRWKEALITPVHKRETVLMLVITAL